RGARDRRFARQESGGKNRGAEQEARRIRGTSCRVGKERRKPGVAYRSRQPRHGDLYEGRRRLQHSDRRRRQAQDDRRTSRVERCCRHGPFATNGGAGSGDSRRRKNRCGRRQELFQERVHLFLRGSRPDAIRAAPAARNAYVCPAGQELTPIREGKLRELKKVDYGNAKACRACPLRPRCTKDVRAVSRLENEDALDRMAERLKARPEILDRRRETVEHPFGSIKQWMNQGAFLMKVSKMSERSSASRRRALNVLGVDAMTA